ncbi:MAG: hypothetical protein QM784_21695 [Polyangiaceae bacterium]
MDLDSDGRIDHIVVFAEMGLGARAQAAVRNLRKTYMKGGVGELQVAVAGIGALSDLRSIDGGMARAVEELLGPGGRRRLVDIHDSFRSASSPQEERSRDTRGSTPRRAQCPRFPCGAD